LRVSRKGLRIIEKKGIEAVLKEINKIWEKKLS
jgi:ribosomal protein L28